MSNLSLKEESAFLIALKELALTLELTELDAVVDAIKQCVLANQCFIPNEKPAIDFIEQLIITSEKEADNSDVVQLMASLSAFWQWLVLRYPLEFVYVGERKNISAFDSIFGKEPPRYTKIVFVDDEMAEDALVELANACLARPILFCDHEGERRVDTGKFLGNITLETARAHLGKHSTALKVVRDHIDMVGVLNNNIARLRSDYSIDKVVLGSSFAYYGMHDSLLKNTVNLSIASGDATYNKALVSHCINNHNIKDFTIIMGFFELFHELSKGNNGYFYLASEFFENNNITYHYRDADSTHKEHFIFHYGNEPIIDLLKINIPQWVIGREVTLLRENAIANPEKIKSIDFHYSSAFILRETQHFSHFYERKGVIEYNKLIFEEIIDLVKQAQGRVNFVIQPFTPRYNSLFHADMRLETKAFISSIADGKTCFFIDMSEDADFCPEDYSDAHHLNFTGAQKLYDKLKWLGL